MSLNWEHSSGVIDDLTDYSDISITNHTLTTDVATPHAATSVDTAASGGGSFLHSIGTVGYGLIVFFVFVGVYSWFSDVGNMFDFIAALSYVIDPIVTEVAWVLMLLLLSGTAYSIGAVVYFNDGSYDSVAIELFAASYILDLILMTMHDVLVDGSSIWIAILWLPGCLGQLLLPLGIAGGIGWLFRKLDEEPNEEEGD